MLHLRTQKHLPHSIEVLLLGKASRNLQNHFKSRSWRDSLQRKVRYKLECYFGTMDIVKFNHEAIRVGI